MLQNFKELYGNQLTAADKSLPLEVQFPASHRFGIRRLLGLLLNGGCARVDGVEPGLRRSLGPLHAIKRAGDFPTHRPLMQFAIRQNALNEN